MNKNTHDSPQAFGWDLLVTILLMISIMAALYVVLALVGWQPGDHQTILIASALSLGSYHASKWLYYHTHDDHARYVGLRWEVDDDP